MGPQDFEKLRRATPSDAYWGDVYFIQPAEGGLIKIGWAIDVSARMAILQCGSPVVLTVIHSEMGTKKREKGFHKLFAAHRRHGEWFEAAPDILTYIEWSKANPPEGPMGPKLTPEQMREMVKCLEF